MTTKRIEKAINEARIYGDCYLGTQSFDAIQDRKRVLKHLQKNDITDLALYYAGNNEGWYIIQL